MQPDESVSEMLDRLISDCGAIAARLEQVEKAAILNVVKWSLESEAVRVQELKEGLEQLAQRLKKNAKKRSA